MSYFSVFLYSCVHIVVHTVENIFIELKKDILTKTTLQLMSYQCDTNYTSVHILLILGLLVPPKLKICIYYTNFNLVKWHKIIMAKMIYLIIVFA